MPDVIINGCPSNLRLPIGATATPVSSDLYSVCDRLKEIHRSLFVVVLSPPQMMIGGRMANFAILQHHEDGNEYVLFKAEELDQRVLQRAAEIVHVPLDQRLKVIEVQEQREEASRLENELNSAYEAWGGDMRHLLAKTGFTGPLPESYRPLNRTARRHGRRA